MLRRAAIQSPNYVPGTSGWTIKQDGSVEFNNGTFRGTLTAATFLGTNFIINTSGAFFYSGMPAAGNLIASIAAVSGTDAFGNAYLAGVTSYNGALVAQLAAGGIALQAAAGQIAGNFAGTVSAGAQAGQVIITSGGNSGADPQAEIVLDSAAVAGTPTVVVVGNLTVQNNTLVQGNLTVTGTASINGSTSTGNGSNGGVTSGPSGTVSSFPAAGPNHTHAETHTHPL